MHHYSLWSAEYQTFFKIALGDRFFFFCCNPPFRRCSSYQDFTKIGSSSESVDLPRHPSDGEGPSQKHRHISRTLSEPSQLTGGRMGTSHSERRGRRSVRQRNSRLSSHLCAWKAHIKIPVVYLKGKIIWERFQLWHAVLFSLQTEPPALLILTEEPVGQTKKNILFLAWAHHPRTQIWWEQDLWHREVSWAHGLTHRWEGLTFDPTTTRSWCRRHCTTHLPHQSWSSNPLLTLQSQRGGRT